MIRLRAVAALTTLAVSVITPVMVDHAAADPLASAQARAAVLAKQVQRLETTEEVETERYDGIEDRLNQAVGLRGQADQKLGAIQSRAAQAQQQVTARTRALYESGGDPAVLAAVLGGASPTDAMTRFNLASFVIAYEAHSAHTDRDAVAAAATLAHRDAVISRRVTKLQVTASNAANRVRSLLKAQRRALAAANGTVRRIMRADERAAAVAGSQDFVSAVEAAGGTINLHGTTKPPNNVVAMAIAAARAELGVPYVWGGTSPAGFDCSGLTQWAYAHAGIQLPRVAADQYNAGPHPSLAHLLPGDLLFWATDTSNPATIHHVTLYIGNGLMIAAPHTGTDVQIQPVYMDGFIGATRPWA